MRRFFLSSVIVGATPLLSNIAAATSWFSSLNVTSVLPTENFVCTKVIPEVSETCQQPTTIMVNSQGKLGIQLSTLNQMTNLLIPQWNGVNHQVPSVNGVENWQLFQFMPELKGTSLGNTRFFLKSDEKLTQSQQELSIIGGVASTNNYSREKTFSSKPTKLKRPDFPKFSRSSLLNYSLDYNNPCSLTKPEDNCARLTDSNFTHPAPDTERVASSFGWRIRPYSGQYQFHQGIDYGAPLGSPVVAATNGIVTKVVSGCLDFRSRWCGNQFGNWIEIDHGNGATAIYGHLLHNSITVKEGMKVWKNQEIAKVGSSGWSTGAHLDFRVKVNGKYQNPTNFVR